MAGRSVLPESPPTSIIAAPSATIARAASASASSERPPGSENESGPAFTIPISSGLPGRGSRTTSRNRSFTPSSAPARNESLGARDISPAVELRRHARLVPAQLRGHGPGHPFWTIGVLGAQGPGVEQAQAGAAHQRVGYRARLLAAGGE